MPPNKQQPDDIKLLLQQLKDEFHSEQTTPLQDKKLTVPVALAAIIITTLVAATWQVSSLYETAINSRINNGIREREVFRKELEALTTKYELTVKAVEGNTQDLDDLWKWKLNQQKNK
jgi:hypothetical protein